jgi:hypothetical protein
VSIQTKDLTDKIAAQLEGDDPQALLDQNLDALEEDGLADAGKVPFAAMAAGTDPGMLTAAVRLGLELGRAEAAAKPVDCVELGCG